MYPPCFVLTLGKRSLSAMCEMAKSSQLRKLKLELRLFCPVVSKISNNLSASEHKIVVSVLYSTTTHFNGKLQESHKKTRKAKLYFFLIYIQKGLKKKEMWQSFLHFQYTSHHLSFLPLLWNVQSVHPPGRTQQTSLGNRTEFMEFIQQKGKKRRWRKRKKNPTQEEWQGR